MVPGGYQYKRDSVVKVQLFGGLFSASKDFIIGPIIP